MKEALSLTTSCPRAALLRRRNKALDRVEKILRDTPEVSITTRRNWSSAWPRRRHGGEYRRYLGSPEDEAVARAIDEIISDVAGKD